MILSDYLWKIIFKINNLVSTNQVATYVVVEVMTKLDVIRMIIICSETYKYISNMCHNS